VERGNKRIELVVVTGVSGAGKSLAIKCLEDLGFYCIDNLPTTLIPEVARLCFQSGIKLDRIALGIDIREGEFLGALPQTLKGIRNLGITSKILFLDASDSVIRRRFDETRRRHPLQTPNRTLEEAMKIEREHLENLKENADIALDTSGLSPWTLRDKVKELFTDHARKGVLTINLISFGYKYGLPTESDLVFDVRFLPNPHYEEELSSLSGKDSRVVEFVMGSEVSKNFLDVFLGFIRYVIPMYVKEGKSYLTISIGCTGGKHRSVVITDLLHRFLEKEDMDLDILTTHRDVDKL
jgi:UPF0042 nucleotide-binding protein